MNWVFELNFELSQLVNAWTLNEVLRFWTWTFELNYFFWTKTSLDSAVHSLTLRCDLDHLLVGRWAWEMSIGTRPCLCSLDTFHGFLLSPQVFGHQQIIRWMEPAHLLIIVKPPFAPNFISFHFQGPTVFPKNIFLKNVFWTFQKSLPHIEKVGGNVIFVASIYGDINMKI